MKHNGLDHIDVSVPRQKGSVGHYFIYALCAVLGLLFGGLLYLWLLLGQMGFADVPVFNKAAGSVENSGAGLDVQNSIAGIYSPSEYPIHAVKALSSDVTNILIFGLDERDPEKPDAPSRTDSMIVLSLDRKHNAIKLTSLMRDIQIDSPNWDGADKLNAAYVYGGIGLMLNSINEMFGLDIQHFMKFDFWSAAKFIDAAGGVTINVTEEELEYVNQSVREQSTLDGSTPQFLSQAGEQKLTGSQAVAWGRIRAIGNDQGRTSRQRAVMMSLLSDFGKQGMSGKLATLTAALPYATTNFSRESLMLFGAQNVQCLDHMAEYRVPEDGMYETHSDNYNIIVDMEQQRPALHRFIYEKSFD